MASLLFVVPCELPFMVMRTHAFIKGKNLSCGYGEPGAYGARAAKLPFTQKKNSATRGAQK
jgi:hypothetical protein